MITLTAYKWVPVAVQGLVRDLRVRWALEEAGLPYTVKLIGLGADQATAEYRALQPFGQVPALEDDGLALFESGAIVLHIAVRSDNLLPPEGDQRQRAITWMFAAINTVEVPIAMMNFMGFAGVKDGPLHERTMGWANTRLDELATVLNGRGYLVEQFSAADLLMATVLNILRDTDLLEKRPALVAYRDRCEARPAYKKALADQMAAYRANAPAS